MVCMKRQDRKNQKSVYAEMNSASVIIDVENRKIYLFK